LARRGEVRDRRWRLSCSTIIPRSLHAEVVGIVRRRRQAVTCGTGMW
jgi:hypothetical protein